MEDKIDLKKLWQQQGTGKPDMDGLLSKLKEFKRANLRKMILTNSMLLVTAAAIICMVSYFHPALMSTKIGIVLVILAMAVYLFSYNKLFADVARIDRGQTNRDYLEALGAFKKRQAYLQTTMISWYFVLLSLGLCLYMYEYAAMMSPAGAFCAYAATFCWIGFCWFYLRPGTIKKQQAKLDGLIGRFENMNEQLKAD